ncbi:ribosome silencing factor [Georgenia halophila]|uniref:Ribosomal silencing factor RsfS n=1 Tax=Georgenia halophila TaxID=620889 RepID=A0ABP8LKD5_9MICO
MVADASARHLAVVAARAAADKKAHEIIALDVSERLVLTDVFLVVSGDNERQVKAIVDGIDEALHREGAKATRKEGVNEARWVLVDYGEIVVHVQHEEDREYYALERLWKDCPAIDLPDELSGPADGEGDAHGDVSA